MSVVWSIAGHDPMGAAGIQADLRVAMRLGVPLRTIIASFTAQNHERMHLCEAVSPAWLDAQWQALAEYERPQVIKLGLIADAKSLEQVRRLLQDTPETPLICDPVLASSSGFAFADQKFLALYRELIYPRVTLLTPNRPEAEQLLGFPVRTEADVIRAARTMRDQGVRAVLIKGGHSEGLDVLDYFDDGERAFWLASSRKPGTFRGTGCALSTAIACKLATQNSLREAVVLGHAALQAALLASQGEQHSILRFGEGQPESLGRISYQGYFPSQAFASIDDGPLGFYPIVPDLSWLKRLLPTGIRTLQLRLKGLDEDACAAAIAEANALCRRADVRLFINDYWELSLEEGAYGVHLGQEDLDRLSPEDCERLRASGLRLGISTHSYEEAARALSYRPSYIALGPIFATTCKSMAFGPQGLARLSEWRTLCPDTPLVAIGGLKLEHAPEAMQRGADSVAVISDVLSHNDPEQRARDWLRAFHPRRA